MVMKHIKDVVVNDILEEDVFQNNLLIVKKGTILSKQIIRQLKKRNIEEVHILSEEKTPIESEEKKNKSIRTAPTLIKPQETFLQVLPHVGHEHRYGRILNQDDDLYFIIQLFNDIHKKYEFIDTIYALQSWDHYSFIHSLDTFILGTLMAKKHHVQNIESVALGFLFHDIGKMKIPQSLLSKQGKLTYDEFEIIKKHTIEGEAILQSFGQSEIAYLARSHHERINGSGYPDQLTEKELSTELKILQIVDVYSALTLKRPYKDGVSAQEAIQILLRDDYLYDIELLFSFIESINIYPPESTVLLSNDTPAKIKQGIKLSPIPDVKPFNQEKFYRLPLDLSITVSKMIDYPTNNFSKRYKKFLNDIIAGNHQLVVEEFPYLIDGFKLEDIYTKILLPVYWEITGKHHSDESNIILNHLLKKLEAELIQTNHYQFKLLLIIDQKLKSMTEINILLNLLHLEKIFPLVSFSDISKVEVQKLMRENNVKDVCWIHLNQEDKQTKETMSSRYINISHQSLNGLNKILREITDLQSQSFQIYKRLFEAHSWDKTKGLLEQLMK